MSRGQARAVVDVAVGRDSVRITPRGWWKVLSLCRRQDIPLEAILSAQVVQRPTEDIPVRFRVGGTGTLTVLAGYMRGPTGRTWWCYRYENPALVLNVSLPKLSSVVVMTDDNAAFAAALTPQAIR